MTMKAELLGGPLHGCEVNVQGEACTYYMVRDPYGNMEAVAWDAVSALDALKNMGGKAWIQPGHGLMADAPKKIPAKIVKMLAKFREDVELVLGSTGQMLARYEFAGQFGLFAGFYKLDGKLLEGYQVTR